MPKIMLAQFIQAYPLMPSCNFFYLMPSRVNYKIYITADDNALFVKVLRK